MKQRKWDVMRSFSFILFAFVFLCVSGAHADGIYGMFMVVKGDVTVINAQNQKNPVKVGSKILPGETVVSGKDSRAKIVMSDRNVMNISPDTTLKIEKYTNDPKTGEKNVELNLIDGKARNNVEQKYDGDKSKFIMKTATAVAGVRGTQFFVSYNAQSQQTQVVTLKGQVSFAPVSVDGSVGKAVMVNKGESTSVTAGAAAPEPPKAMPKEELNKVDKESTAAANTAPKESAPAEKKSAESKKDEGKGDTAKADTKSENANGAATTAAPKDASAAKETAKEGSGNADSATKSSGPASREPASDTSAGKGDGNAAPKSGGLASAAPGSAAAPGSGPKMVDSKDMSMDLVKNITPPTVGAAPTPPPVFFTPPPLAPPPPPPSLNDIIKNYNGTTKVIIVPN